MSYRDQLPAEHYAALVDCFGDVMVLFGDTLLVHGVDCSIWLENSCIVWAGDNEPFRSGQFIQSIAESVWEAGYHVDEPVLKCCVPSYVRR